jgi:hypothetical protein
MIERAPSEMPDTLAARQREHRLKNRVWPRERPSRNADPWLLADEALDCLDRVGKALGLQRLALVDLEQAQEVIKQLAVGPED